MGFRPMPLREKGRKRHGLETHATPDSRFRNRPEGCQNDGAKFLPAADAEPKLLPDDKRISGPAPARRPQHARP